MFGVLINNCYVTDGFGKRADVVDSKGLILPIFSSNASLSHLYIFFANCSTSAMQFYKSPVQMTKAKAIFEVSWPSSLAGYHLVQQYLCFALHFSFIYQIF